MFNLIDPNKNDRIEEYKNTNTEGGQQITPGYLRLQKDLKDLDKDLPNNAKLEWPDKNQLSIMLLTATPAKESLWNGGVYKFRIEVGADYPHQPPKVHCETLIYHPNIDLQGNVCLNILRADWKPVLNLNNIILGILFLFIEPNPTDPLNKEAAELQRNDPNGFADLVKRTLKGGTFNQIKGVTFKKMI